MPTGLPRDIAVPHVVLLGDSVFDNARYVPGEPPVIEQLRGELPDGWQATLLAVDGNITRDVADQLNRLPEDTTHLVVSVGGNDALAASGLLHQRANSVREAIGYLVRAQAGFRQDYRDMLLALAGAGLPTALCTIYDSIPGLEPAAVTALAAFNDEILRGAIDEGWPVVDLRIVCDDKTDYSSLSPIEPSRQGGEKIARAIANLLQQHDFSLRRTTIYGRE
jgi:hypothetical protein